MAEFELSLPPFLKSQLLAGRVIPFLGAGISRNAGLPDWQGLLERLVDWSTVNGIPINSPDVLKAIKAQEFEPAAHELEILGDRLIEALTQILTANSAQPTKVHRIIASVIWPAIITTNFDSLLPQSCSDLKVCTWNEHQEIGTILKMGNPHLMMLHGWISRPSSIVLAPRAYRESVRNPALQVYMRNMLSQHTFVFMGFSMKDQDLELYLADQQFALDKADLPHFALLPESEATSLKQRHLRDNYGIQVITYNPSCSAHPEVEFFAKLLVDHIPQQYLHDPKSRIRDLNDIRVAQAQLSPSEYYKRFREACQRLADSGFLRTAWTSLQSELRNQTDTIPIAERFEFMIVATEMRLLDDATSLAFYELREMIPLLNNSELEDKLKLRFENVLFKVCLNEYQLAEAQSCVARVEQMKCGEVEVARMSSLLVLANFLHTDDTIPTVNISGHYEIAATAESMAMRGEFESAQVYLRCKAESFAELTVSCWLFMKQAELHFVDGRHFEALEILDTKGFPSIATLPREQRIALENNRSFLHILVGKQDATRDFNSAVDQARDSREANHLRQLVRAEQASLEKKHYDSLPILWRDLLQNYFDGDWNGRKSAHARFASEAFAAEWILPATHHAILGDADKLLVRIAQRLSSSPQPEQLDQVVSYLLKNCHLTQHAMTAAKMLQHLGDVIPDSRIAELVDRVDQMLARPEITRADKVAIEGALELIEHVAFRLSQDEAIRLIRRVMNHCSMTAVGWSRLARVKSLSAMVDYVRAFDWRSFAISILPLAKEQRYEGDLENVLFLLEQVAERDSSAQALIADTLIPSGIPQTNHQMQELGLKLVHRTVSSL